MEYTGFDKYLEMSEDKADEIANEYVTKWEYLSGRRGNWENHWTEIAERIWPMHSNLFMSANSLQSEGDKRNREVFDSTPVLALQRFGAILDSMLTPRNQFWHQLKPSDRTLLKHKETLDWFQEVNNILFEQRYAPNANFASQNQMQYLSLGGYGTGCLFIDDLAGSPGIRYKNIHLSEIYLEENHQGIIDKVCRYFFLPARAAVQRWGDKLPKTIIEKAKTAPEEPFYFLHWVCPQTDKDPERKDYKGMDYVSYYISITERKTLSTGGYRRLPYATSRYFQAPQETYGRSPAMDCLPAIKTLNKQKETLLKQGQLATDPVMLVHDDGIMDGASLESGTFISGAITADGRSLAQPLAVGRIDIGLELMNEERKSINDSFLVNLFQILVETPEMSATEVMERTREKGILLAPTVGRQHSEYLGPVIDRELDILNRQGLLPPMPQYLIDAGGDYQVVYDSPITRTQKSEWAAGAMRTLEVAMQLSQATQDPTPLFYFNKDIMMPELAEIYGTPSKWMNSPEAVDQLKKQHQALQQAQLAIQAAPAAAGLAKAQSNS